MSLIIQCVSLQDISLRVCAPVRVCARVHMRVTVFCDQCVSLPLIVNSKKATEFFFFFFFCLPLNPNT
jgi:hypothetical protein